MVREEERNTHMDKKTLDKLSFNVPYREMVIDKVNI